MFRDEHYAAGQAVEAVTGHGIPAVAALGAHDFDYGVVVVAAGWVDGNSGGLVDYDHAFVFVDDRDGLACDWRFMAVKRVADHVAVFHEGCC